MRALQTERLDLEPVTSVNSRKLWQLLQSPHLREFQELPSAGLEQFSRMVAERPHLLQPKAVGRFEWLMLPQGGGDPVGWVSLRLSDRDLTAGEIGYSVLYAHRGNGYSEEAVRALITEAFAVAKLRRIRAYCVPENRASRAVLRRLGFVPDGLLPHGATVGGRTVDILAFVYSRQPAWK